MTKKAPRSCGIVSLLRHDLRSLTYADKSLRVKIDDRDLRGGEKSWQHIKQGVPIRIEVGPRDLASDSLFVARRDLGVKEKSAVPRIQFLSEVATMLQEIQDGLFQRALSLRQENTHNIDSLDDFRAFFTPKNEKRPELHGGFAMSHWVDDPRVDKILKPLKVTVRCIPLGADGEPGQCIFTGQTSPRRVVFAKAY